MITIYAKKWKYTVKIKTQISKITKIIKEKINTSV